MLNMSEERLDQIAVRYDLWATYGSRDALKPGDVADLITEVRELRAQRAHLIALNRQYLARLGGLGTDDTGAAPGTDDPEVGR